MGSGVLHIQCLFVNAVSIIRSRSVRIDCRFLIEPGFWNSINRHAPNTISQYSYRLYKIYHTAPYSTLKSCSHKSGMGLWIRLLRRAMQRLVQINLKFCKISRRPLNVLFPNFGHLSLFFTSQFKQLVDLYSGWCDHVKPVSNVTLFHGDLIIQQNNNNDTLLLIGHRLHDTTPIG